MESEITATETANFIVRPFCRKDREAVRWVCCQTGFLGNPVDPLFEDRELFADYLTRYYTDVEPESAFVLEQDRQVRGYILGCRFQKKQKRFDCFQNISLFARGVWRYFFRYNEASKKFVRWILTQGRKQIPHTPPNMAHFHINLLPEYRKVAHTRALIDRLLQWFVQAGEKHVYGQVIVFENRRGARMFARYGFKVVDEVEVTKYRDLTPKPVYLFTVVKDLQKNAQLYGHDLWKENQDGCS
ncbi:MAG: GNAT family acetyltransferase [Verrucomicrobiota bacterium]